LDNVAGNLMRTPLLTIGIPLYQAARYDGALLIRCLKSLKNQTFSDFKVILVNNNSSDNTEEIVLNAIKDDNRFEYYNNVDNYGFFYNFFRIITSCYTKYISELHFDSYWHPTYAEKCIETLENNNNCVIAYSYCQYIDQDNNFISVYKDKITFDDDNPVNRYICTVSRLGYCIPFHGIIRYKNAVKHYLRSANCLNAAFDNQFVSLMSLEGKLIQIKDILFYKVKDDYHKIRETVKKRYLRLYSTTNLYQNIVNLPFCRFIKDFCTDIRKSNLSNNDKDILIDKTISILLKKFRHSLKYEINRAIDLIISGKFKSDYNDNNIIITNNFINLNFFNLVELSNDLHFASIIMPNFPRLNLAMHHITIFFDRYQSALPYMKVEKKLNVYNYIYRFTVIFIIIVVLILFFMFK
jgi:glycosyltransferase involved in cell wall biosynthesis